MDSAVPDRPGPHIGPGDGNGRRRMTRTTKVHETQTPVTEQAHPDTDDAHEWTRVKDGGKGWEAVERITVEELPKLPGWFRKKGVENTHDAEDLSQATIETFRQRVNPDRPAGAIAGYLYRCANSRLVDHWRKLAVERGTLVRRDRENDELREAIRRQDQRQARLDAYYNLYGGGDATVGPPAFCGDGNDGPVIGPCIGAEQRAQAAMRELLKTAEKVLAPRQLEAFNLCYLVGHTQVEAAKIMGCKPQSVHAILHDAKRKLRHALGDDFLPWAVQEDARVHEEMRGSSGPTEDE